MSISTPSPQSVLTGDQMDAIAMHARIRQLEIELTAEKETSARLRTQRDQARHAGGVLIAQRDRLTDELIESRELVRAQALSLEKMTNRVRKADLALSKLDPSGATRA